MGGKSFSGLHDSGCQIIIALGCLGVSVRGEQAAQRLPDAPVTVKKCRVFCHKTKE